jgi:hypothetical protein
MGNDRYPPLAPAPGTYVREMGGDVKYPAGDVTAAVAANGTGA